MASKGRDVTEAELAVMQVLWLHGGRTIREVAAMLDEANQDAYYATVKKLLERLEAKGFVRRKPQGIAYLYEAMVGRDELVGQRLRTLADSLCEGSVTPLLTQLAQHERLSKKQQTALLALIGELAAEEGGEKEKEKEKSKERKPQGRKR